MNAPLIEQAITAHWGERCREPEPGCPVCNAWHELDMLKARADKYETTLPTLEEVQAIYRAIKEEPAEGKECPKCGCQLFSPFDDSKQIHFPDQCSTNQP